MTIEEALRDRLETITGLENKVFPLSAKKGTSAPYVIYVGHVGRNNKSIDGSSLMYEVPIEINILHNKYRLLKEMVRAIVNALENINVTHLLGTLSIQEVVIEDSNTEVYEHQVDMYRSILNTTFYLEEV